ncbi:G-protein coupled receptor dmsr-1-like [Littorina saxatilis]|uniref:G-protein coupled receptors family 1 profile domain-containing protein n=1 Tax=Littorina saxatilis TaxID=31220 RepID=A0AAN9AUH4_9CAEN
MSDCQNVNATALKSFGDCYWHVHGYVSLALCIYGVITNIINISILTKNSMINPINCLLTGIAVADIITMTSYIPFVIHFYLLNSVDITPQRNSYGWMMFLTVHLNLTLTSHTASIWLGVIMAIMRYHIIHRSQGRGARAINCRTSILLIFCTFGGAAFLVIPNYIITDMRPWPGPPNETQFWVLDMPIGKNQTDKMAVITFLVYPIAGKIIPILLISFFGGLLLRTLWETDKRGRRLKGDNTSSHNQNRRTTMMLLAIIVMYILSEVPQSVLVILCVAVKDFFRDVYMPLSDIIDVFALINSAINFGMYCTMSRQFRTTLTESIDHCLASCKKKNQHMNGETTTLTHV